MHENAHADEHDDGRRGWFAVRDGPIDGIVVHTTGTDAAPEVADYYATTRHPVSAHVIVDDAGWIKLLPDELVADDARRAERALAVEIAYDHRDWGSDPVREDVLLQLAAAWCAVRARRHDIPVRELTADEWRDGGRGFVGHDTLDWRYDDPGTAFPWERFLALVASMAGVAHSSAR